MIAVTCFSLSHRKSLFISKRRMPASVTPAKRDSIESKTTRLAPMETGGHVTGGAADHRRRVECRNSGGGGEIAGCARAVDSREGAGHRRVVRECVPHRLLERHGGGCGGRLCPDVPGAGRQGDEGGQGTPYHCVHLDLECGGHVHSCSKSSPNSSPTFCFAARRARRPAGVSRYRRRRRPSRASTTFERSRPSSSRRCRIGYIVPAESA